MKMRNATKQERASVDNYIRSISEPIYSFTQEELNEHDAKVRAETIDEIIAKCRKYKAISQDAVCKIRSRNNKINRRKLK